MSLWDRARIKQDDYDLLVSRPPKTVDDMDRQTIFCGVHFPILYSALLTDADNPCTVIPKESYFSIFCYERQFLHATDELGCCITTDLQGSLAVDLICFIPMHFSRQGLDAPFTVRFRLPKVWLRALIGEWCTPGVHYMIANNNYTAPFAQHDSKNLEVICEKALPSRSVIKAGYDQH